MIGKGEEGLNGEAAAHFFAPVCSSRSGPEAGPAFLPVEPPPLSGSIKQHQQLSHVVVLCIWVSEILPVLVKFLISASEAKNHPAALQ